MSFLNLISNCFSRKNHREHDNMEANKEIFLKKIQNRLANEGAKLGFLPNPGEDSRRESLGEISSKTLGTVGARKGYSTDESSTYDDLESFSEAGDSPVFSKEDWLQIIKNGHVDSMSFSELANSLRHGIPSELRPMIWEFLTDLESLKKQYPKNYYKDLKSKACPSDKYIEKDVPRTYPEHSFFMENDENQAHLHNILRAYANHDKQVGYTQGMNYIAGMLLIILDPDNYKDSELSYFKNYKEEFEEKAFWIFIYILCVKNFRITYKSELPKFHGMIKALDAKIKAKAPDVYTLIKTNELQIAQCFQEKLLSMLFSHTPVPLASIILDMFFVDEERILFKVIIRSILICKKEILELRDSMELLSFFNKRLLETCYEKCKDRMYLLFPGPEYAD